METEHRLDVGWPGRRPYLGGSLLIVGGVLTGYVPVQFLVDLVAIGGLSTAVGVVFAALFFLTGVVVILRPSTAPLLGVVGLVLSVLSVPSVLGVLLVGPLFAFLGGCVCILWWAVTP